MRRVMLAALAALLIATPAAGQVRDSVRVDVSVAIRVDTIAVTDTVFRTDTVFVPSPPDTVFLPPGSTPPDTMEPPASPPPGVNLTPAELMPTIGPLVAAADTGIVAVLDSLYENREPVIYSQWDANRGTGTTMNHYGALRSRLQYAIRHGQPFGTGATDPASYLYGRGREVQVHYLNNYASPNHNPQPHNNTALADIEAFYHLEGDTVAYNHIWGTATGSISVSPERFRMQIGDARQVAVPLASYNAAHRLGIPFQKFPGSSSSWNDFNVTSWQHAGEAQIDSILRYGNVDGTTGVVHSEAHFSTGQCGSVTPCEAYFMNAMLATELLRWYGFVNEYAPAFNTARAIVDHLIAEHARHGLAVLPYLSTQATPAWDIAGFYVWPALVLWQETGDDKYRAFALAHRDGARKAWLMTKQFNETFSTGLQNAEALLAGVPWR